MNKHILNELYHQYSQKLLEKRDFEELLIRHIMDNLRYFNLGSWEKDESMDYISWVYPRLSKAIDSFNEISATFETYIGTLIRWSAKEYRTRRMDRQIAEQAVWASRQSNSYVHEEEPEYCKDGDAGKEEKKEIQPYNNPRQLLILILKCYYYLSDNFLERLAPRVGMEKEELKKLVENVREQRTQRDDEVQRMKEHIHSQFYRCMVYERKMNAIRENQILFLSTEKKYNKARQRLALMKKRLATLRLDATNRQIALVLGTSKGTIDSNYHALREKAKTPEGINSMKPLPPIEPPPPGKRNPKARRRKRGVRPPVLGQ